MMAKKLPRCTIHQTTTIDYQIKILKRKFQAISEMQRPSCSGFDDIELREYAQRHLPIQGLHMSPEDIVGTRPGHLSEGRMGLRGSKRKQGDQNMKVVEVIRSAMKYAND
ncbi:RING-H2 finger protein ATL66 [Cucumis melo var. makuwa]|uniref:RING-H2 finger protein ATL66 n=1 Tax=Cucumis melo var. makuwa TaxID=1194695 RepID=A0A5A7TGC2_CUCMM|nr:RING-H2 finger protein ATL66 [Cucumis melo var. makuwa]